MNDLRTMYETAKAIRTHLAEQLDNVSAYQDETRVLYGRLQGLSKRLYDRLLRAIECEERLATQVAAESRPTRRNAA
jgi:hypothetical protein